jgi:hypothetical protein
VVATAGLLAAGSILVAIFHGSAEAFADGTASYHALGATVGFVSGNVLVILIGRLHQVLGLSRRLGRLLVGSGILGLVSMVAFGAVVASGAGVLIGLFERGAIYFFLIGLMILGAALRKRRPIEP